ncbi:MAG TPA: response regulator [Bryobacteraceae bacterium]|jgi:two-component system cell cycle sensor histidine kinase/response regulator CckA
MLLDNQTPGFVLLVDDEQAVVELMKAVLTADGYRVVTAPDGLSAWSAIEASGGAIDLVITDVIMPEMDGLELSSRLRINYPDLPVLLITGFVSRGIQEYVTGRVSLLQKPFTPKKLLTSVRSALQPTLAASSPAGDAAAA